MAHKNYLVGRRWEYDSIKRWREKNYACIRASGSHGLFDLVAFRVDRKPEFIQCKVVGEPTKGKLLIKRFRETTLPSDFYHQALEVKIKGSKEILTITV